jgi:hypothetical protein
MSKSNHNEYIVFITQKDVQNETGIPRSGLAPQIDKVMVSIMKPPRSSRSLDIYKMVSSTVYNTWKKVKHS